MGNDPVISTADATCGPHAFQPNFQFFVTQMYSPPRAFLVTMESPEVRSQLVAVIPPSP
jgi:hypothetical protein